MTPRITIRDRLRVLFPNDPNNFYRERDILPVELIAEIIVVNDLGRRSAEDGKDRNQGDQPLRR